MKILVNAIKCKSCQVVVVSLHRHDFRYCKCQKVAADGGTDYLKRVGESEDRQEESLVLLEKGDEFIGKKIGPHKDETADQGRIYKLSDLNSVY
jgi:hypothetical protein